MGLALAPSERLILKSWNQLDLFTVMYSTSFLHVSPFPILQVFFSVPSDITNVASRARVLVERTSGSSECGPSVNLKVGFKSNSNVLSDANLKPLLRYYFVFGTRYGPLSIGEWWKKTSIGCWIQSCHIGRL
mmetsp:Transcript_16143/g.24132  ORF Transcript_16143/g.24132 Transcript_16143/m.24132 type:complete len:132 (-) Transcript_16143:569-964(-)